MQFDLDGYNDDYDVQNHLYFLNNNINIYK
jgi:hypothetical protein